jgi:hypothetical protein
MAMFTHFSVPVDTLRSGSEHRLVNFQQSAGSVREGRKKALNFHENALKTRRRAKEQ